MKEINKPYDPVKVDNIRRMLDNESKNGNPRYYEIWVDNVKVVERTNDPRVFNTYEEFLYDETSMVTINLFTASQSSAHIVSRHNFSLEEEPKKEMIGLAGFSLGEIDAKINEKVSEKVSIERERWDCQQVRSDLAITKEKLKEAEEYAETLEGIIDETKTKLEEAKGTSEIASIIKDLAVTQLPNLLGKKQVEKAALSGNEKAEGEASYKAKSSEEVISLSEQDKHFIAFGNFVQKNFSKEEFAKVFLIINAFAKDKASIETVLSLLNVNTHNQTPKQDEKI